MLSGIEDMNYIFSAKRELKSLRSAVAVILSKCDWHRDIDIAAVSRPIFYTYYGLIVAVELRKGVVRYNVWTFVISMQYIASLFDDSPLLLGF